MKGDLPYVTVKGTEMSFRACVVGNDVSVGELVRAILRWYFPPPAVVWDPTPGDKNYQFRDRLVRKGDRWVYDGEYVYRASSIDPGNPWAEAIYDVLSGEPPPWNDIDVTVYDPPYLPRQSETDKRMGDYGDLNRTDPPVFYKPEILGKLMGRRGIVIKGADYYTDDDFFVSFMHDILPLDWLRSQYTVYPILYRYMSRGVELARARLRTRRPVFNYSYYVVVVRPVTP